MGFNSFHICLFGVWGGMHVKVRKLTLRSQFSPCNIQSSNPSCQVCVQVPLPAGPLHEPRVKPFPVFFPKSKGTDLGNWDGPEAGPRLHSCTWELLWVLFLCQGIYKNMGLTCTHASTHTAGLEVSVVLDSHSVSNTESFAAVLDFLPMQPQSLANRWGDRSD